MIEEMIKENKSNVKALRGQDVNDVIDTVVSTGIKNECTRTILKWASRQGSCRVYILDNIFIVDGRRFM